MKNAVNRTAQLIGLLILPQLVWGETPLLEQLDFNSGHNNRDFTVSPDSQVRLTSITSPRNDFAAIVISRRTEQGQWSEFQVAPFSGRYQDIEPMFSPDGKQLLFASKRPHQANKGTNWDIWKVPVTVDGTFGSPTVLPAPVNTEGNEFYPSTSIDGRLYFTSDRKGSFGHEDIFTAKVVDGDYVVENVGAGVNSAHWEFNSFVAADGSYLLFTSQGREDDLGRGDLYISYRNEQDQFGPAVHLGDKINSSSLDYCPFVFNNWLYFSSNRTHGYQQDTAYTFETLLENLEGAGNGLGDIYKISWQAVPLP